MSGAVIINKTSNVNLQNQLEQWVTLIEACFQPGSADERKQRVHAFCTTFVPPDVAQSSDDVDYFVNNLCSDEEYFESVRRDIGQCASGQHVETITPKKQNKRAVFTLKPPPELSKLLVI